MCPVKYLTTASMIWGMIEQGLKGRPFSEKTEQRYLKGLIVPGLTLVCVFSARA